MQIREITLQELEYAYEVVKELRSELSYDEFEDLVYEMRHQEYKMFGIFKHDELICFAGLSILVNLYHKRHLYLYDLVTKSTHRYQGYGKEMMLYLSDYAKLRQCKHMVLSSRLERHDAHRFYEQEGFQDTSKLYVKTL